MDDKLMMLRAEVRRLRPLRLEWIPRRDGEYRRCGAANAFCGVELNAERHVIKGQASPIELQMNMNFSLLCTVAKASVLSDRPLQTSNKQ